MLVKYKSLPWPLNLWSTVLGRETTETDLPDDWRQALSHALGFLSSSKREDVLLCYYRDGMTLREIGSRYGTSAETVRQHADKVVRQLRKPSIKIYFCLGMSRAQAALEAEAEAQRVPQLPDENSIDILDLPLRAWNCLRRVGIDTVDHLIQHSAQDLSKYRNIGAVTIRAVECCLAARGLSLRSEEEEG